MDKRQIPFFAFRLADTTREPRPDREAPYPKWKARGDIPATGCTDDRFPGHVRAYDQLCANASGLYC